MKKVIVNNRHDRHLFLADEVVFEVVHLATTGGIPEAIKEFLNDPQFGDENWRKRIQQPNSDSRIINFLSPTQSQESEIFSLIPLKIDGHDPLDPNPVDVLILLNDVYTELGDSFPLNLKDQSGNSLGVSLVSISPNWLASDLHHGGNTGGPGSMPARKNAPADIPPKFKLKGKEERLDSLLVHKPEVAGEGVEVVILDTAISLENGVDVTININGDKEHVAFSPGITKMLAGRPNHPDYPRMVVVAYPYPNELNACDPYAAWPHHYEMPDHGTFIASIVRAIAPTVKIHLYEVLNRFGVGSLISIAEGVVNAVNRRGNNTIPVLVMNCSFMLENDLEALVIDGLDEAALQALQELLPPELEQKEKRERNQKLLEHSMQDVFKWVTTSDLNIVVVAAAGNDGLDGNGNRLPPHYPAAFMNVLSVAALPKGNPRHPQSNTANSRKYKSATYSNLAHSPGSNKEAHSFATFGGDLVNGSSRPTGGVVGVYFGGIPTQNPDGTFNPGPVNTTGWAQWSGTSFSAPIISALLADSGLEADNTNVPFSDPPNPARPYRSVDDENVILVRQGP